MRLGIFGGTFDPIHMAHLILAEQCREACRLERVLFVPTGQPPHKSGRQITAAKQRLEMVELAIAGHPNLEASSLEIDRPGPSYSAETLRELAGKEPESELFFIIGSDSLADMRSWYHPERITALATLVVATRPGAVRPEPESVRPVIGLRSVDPLQLCLVDSPLVDISSSDIRARVAAGRSIRYLVPRAVECYIETHGLYQDRSNR